MTSCRCSPAPGSRRDCSGRFLLTRAARRPFSALGGGLLRLPVDDRVKRLKAHAADNLLESGVVAAGRDKQGLTLTCGESSKFSLVSLRRPNAALEAA